MSNQRCRNRHLLLSYGARWSQHILCSTGYDITGTENLLSCQSSKFDLFHCHPHNSCCEAKCCSKQQNFSDDPWSNMHVFACSVARFSQDCFGVSCSVSELFDALATITFITIIRTVQTTLQFSLKGLHSLFYKFNIMDASSCSHTVPSWASCMAASWSNSKLYKSVVVHKTNKTVEHLYASCSAGFKANTHAWIAGGDPAEVQRGWPKEERDHHPFPGHAQWDSGPNWGTQQPQHQTVSGERRSCRKTEGTHFTIRPARGGMDPATLWTHTDTRIT